MLFGSRAEAEDAFLVQVMDDRGATAFRWVDFEDGFGREDEVLIETLNGDGTSAIEVFKIDARIGGRDPITNEYQYYGRFRSDVETLTENAVSGTLDQIEFSDPANVAGVGYDQKFSITFQTASGDETRVLYDDEYPGEIGGYDGTSTDPVNPAFVRDLAFVDENVSESQGTPNEDQVTLKDVPEYRAFKGDDVIITRDAATIYGGSGDDIIQTGSGDDSLFGNQSDDQIFSGKGTDYIDGGTGDDRIYLGETGEARGGKGNDLLRSDGNGQLYGGQGEDYLSTSTVGGTLVGGDGADRLYGGRKTGGDDEMGDFLYGGKSNDSIFGSANGDEIYGGTGNDFMRGWTGDDVIRGGSGNDTAFGGYGDDTVYGGDGSDELHGDRGMDALYGGKGKDVLFLNDTGFGNSADLGGVAYGGQGSDVLFGGREQDALFGGKGSDSLDGGRGNDTLDGGSGNDVLSGGNNDDQLNGGDGKDTVEGGSGDDFIRGGHDDDVLTGGQGDDIFGFGEDGSTDVVTDFDVRNDQIELVNFSGDLSFDDLFLSQEDSTAVIQAGDVTIRLENTDVEDLDEASFLL